jgi:hypothetical protein
MVALVRFLSLNKQDNILDIIDYIFKKISEILYHFSVIEWHSNVTEVSYSNHDDHPHSHKQEDLLHINFIDNNFF